MASEVNPLILVENYVEFTYSYPELTLTNTSDEDAGRTPANALGWGEIPATLRYPLKRRTLPAALSTASRFR